MLQLAQKLADCDMKFFEDGWVLAGVEVHIKGNAVHLENKTLMEKERKCIMEVTGTTAFGTKTKTMRVFMVKLENSGEQEFTVEYPGKLLFKHSFTKEEIQSYIAYTGDKNVIHQGEHPIVPGICMTAYLQEMLQLEQVDWRIAFKAPVYAEEELVVYGTEKQLTAYVHEKVAFVIKLS